MKKIKYLILVAASFFITSFPVLAVSPNDLRVTVAAIRRQVEEKRLERAEQIQQTQQIRTDMASRHANRLTPRFTLYHSRLLRLLNKISQRAQIMADNGQDTVAAVQAIDQAAVSLDQAKDKGEEAIALFQSIDPDTYQAQKEIALQARDLAQEARTLFSQTHNLLKQVVSELKQAN